MINTNRKPILVTLGEPSSIAAEITLKAWFALHNNPRYCFVWHTDPDFVKSVCAALRINVQVKIISDPKDAEPNFYSHLPVWPMQLPVKPQFGKPHMDNCRAAAESIRQSVEWCHAHKFDAMVTNPINKSAMRESGFKFPGHTEYLGELCGGMKTVMMLANEQLRVIPLTGHIPLNEVSQKIDMQHLRFICKTANDSLRQYFGIGKPRIAVAGLNPHAGENATMGREEQSLIAPAIGQLKRDGYNVTGPHSADTLFFAESRAGYDVAIGMYHDQVLIPIKTVDFWNTVNVTLGLDIIRTSPDHGTALDIAGKGVAKADSMAAAIRMARHMADRKAAALL